MAHKIERCGKAGKSIPKTATWLERSQSPAAMADRPRKVGGSKAAWARRCGRVTIWRLPLCFLVVVTLLLTACEGLPGRPTPTLPPFDARLTGKSIRFEGVVVRKVDDVFDAPEALLVRVGDQEIVVIYNWPTYPFCANEEVREIAAEIEPGDRVEVFGQVVRASATVSVCESSEHYLRKIGQ